jgi:hypothetical protein
VTLDQDIAQRKETVDAIDTKRFRLIERRRPTETELTEYDRQPAVFHVRILGCQAFRLGRIRLEDKDTGGCWVEELGEDNNG